MVDRSTRSQAYQHLLVETVFSHEMLSSFSNEDSISARLNPWEYSEELLELEDQLKKEFYRIIKMLTKRQQDVIRLCAEGKTQCEVAKELGVNQSSVAKNLLGNISYQSNGTKKFFGGSKKRLNKIIETDEKIIEILRKMSEIRSEKW